MCIATLAQHRAGPTAGWAPPGSGTRFMLGPYPFFQGEFRVIGYPERTPFKANTKPLKKGYDLDSFPAT